MFRDVCALFAIFAHFSRFLRMLRDFLEVESTELVVEVDFGWTVAFQLVLSHPRLLVGQLLFVGASQN